MLLLTASTSGILKLLGVKDRDGSDVTQEEVATILAEGTSAGLIEPEEQVMIGEILRLGADKVAAFIFEPVVGAAGGAVPAPEGYARRIREICDRHSVLMIADEVMCGVGRCGTWRALEHDGVRPDLMSIAKGLGGGYLPLGATVYSEKVAEPIYEKDGMPITGHTFTAHTTSCAAGLAVQKIMEREKLVERVATEGVHLKTRLEEKLGQHAHVGDIRGRGFFVGIELVEDRETKEPFSPDHALVKKIMATGLENGIIVYPTGGNVDGVKGDQVIIAPPYNATREELDEIVDLFAVVVDQAIGKIGSCARRRQRRARPRARRRHLPRANARRLASRSPTRRSTSPWTPTTPRARS